MHLRSEVGDHSCFVCGPLVGLDASGTVKARRVIYSVGMNGDRRHVNGPEALFRSGGGRCPYAQRLWPLPDRYAQRMVKVRR
jgi:hypothetical protein